MKPEFGKIGLPATAQKAKISGTELYADKLIAAIELHGARFAWTCAAWCPCAPINVQTQRPDPTCTKCLGTGRFYFGPKDYVIPEDAGELDDLQQAVVRTNGAAVISGSLLRAARAQDFYDILGNWERGTMMISVRPENRLGYYDRLINLDSRIPLTEVLVSDGVTTTVSLKYPAVGVNGIFTLDARYEEGVDFELNGMGHLVWNEPLEADTRYSVHYLTYPSWIVVDHPHIIRETKRRLKVKNRTTPVGTPVETPLQATVRLEFLRDYVLEAPP